MWRRNKLNMRRRNWPKICKHILVIVSVIFLCGFISYHYFDLGTSLELYQLANLKGPPARNREIKVIDHVQLPKRFKGKQLAFHQVFEPRKVSFIGYNYTEGTWKKGDRPKTILLGTPWNGVWTTINYYYLRPDDASFTLFGCPNSNCVVTKDQSQIEEADAVLFHLLDLPEEFPKYRHPSQIWIAYILEAPWRIRANNIDLSTVNGIFNWTMSYRDDSDVVIKYGFVGPLQKVSKMDKIPFSEKKYVVWFVSDCKVDSHREEYVEELRKYVSVDIYGSCGNKKCFPSQSSVCYEDVLKSYKFYLSFENSICDDYVTEKYFNILEYDVVPIVFGGADYEKIGPPGAYIDATKYPNPINLAGYLNELANDEDKYLKHLEWKSSYQSFLHPWMCYLCDKLHIPVKKSTVKLDLKKWWMDDAHCKIWSKERGFVPKE